MWTSIRGSRARTWFSRRPTTAGSHRCGTAARHGRAVRLGRRSAGDATLRVGDWTPARPSGRRASRSGLRTRAGWTRWSRSGSGGWRPPPTPSSAARPGSWPTTSPRCRPPGSRRSSAATPTWATSASTPRPERDLVFDLNDFDEAHPGAWEWDLRRLAASVWVAGRQNGPPEAQCGEAVRRCVAAYREHVRWLADAAAARPRLRAPGRRPARTGRRLRRRRCVRRSPAPARRARSRTSDRALPRFTEQRDGPRPHRGGAAADHPRRDPAEASSIAEAPRRLPDDAADRTGAGSSAATPWSTSPTRSSASARSGCAPTSRCARAAARTTSCSSSSSRPAAPSSRRSCTASRPGTPTRASAWWSTSRRCRR